jgi:PKHD-type hydroxylase
MWYLNKNKYENWAFVENFFSKEECESIIEIGTRKMEVAGTGNGIISEIRKSDVNHFRHNNENRWIFEKITDGILSVNQLFNFDLTHFLTIQFTRYETPEGWYKNHTDVGSEFSSRKLSLSIQLSDPSDYEGGELALQFGVNPLIIPKDRGLLVAFPSYVLHEVKPMTKGTRYSLVVWVDGPPFK